MRIVKNQYISGHFSSSSVIWEFPHSTVVSENLESLTTLVGMVIGMCMGMETKTLHNPKKAYGRIYNQRTVVTSKTYPDTVFEFIIEE